MRKLTTKEFIKQAKSVHGNRYNYSKVDYKSVHSKVIIGCKEHGYFEQEPGSHNSGRGCPDCAGTKQLTTNEFIKRGKKKYGNKYNYSKVIYKTTSKKVIIICPIHGEFKQSPRKHLGNQTGCTKCGGDQTSKKLTYTNDKFIEISKKYHGDLYDYSKTKYINQKKLVTIICKKHGPFRIIAGSHTNSLLLRGCQKCGYIRHLDSQKMPIDEWKARAKKAHGDFYDYANVAYEKVIDHVEIICPKHGSFLQNASTHIYGHGCPRCKLKGEGFIANYLLKNNIIFKQFKIKDRLYDFYLPKFSLIIERDGEQHYKDINFYGKLNSSKLKNVRKNDIYKKRIAKNNGYKIARIPYWLNNFQVIKEIDNILNGRPTYPDIPDLKQEKTQPLPN